MSEINNSGLNPKDIKLQSAYAPANNAPAKADSAAAPKEAQQKDASAPVEEALGKSMVKVDNHDADMQKLLNNPKVAETSDKMFNAATKAGVGYPEAATFATTEAK